MKNLILIDGHSLAYRMYFALERTRMQTADKFPTWAVYGFFKALFDLVKQVEPDGMAVAFDLSRVSFRTEMFPEYKANRESMPDHMRQQMAKIREGIELLGIPIFERENYEADDLIGALARQAADRGTGVVILTGDQDAFQIVDDHKNISILYPSFKGGLTRYDRQKVYEKLGVYPEQITDFKGLKGDTSDNIPGVPGVGDKTAAKLLAEYQTLENVLANLDRISGKKLKENLETYREQAILSKQLATIDFDAPIEYSEEACHLSMPDVDHFLQFLAEMEFKTFLGQSQSLLRPFITHADGVEGEAGAVAVLVKEADQLVLTNGHGKTVEDLLPQTERIESLIQLLEVDHHIVTSREQLEAFLAKVRQNNVLIFDIETTGLDYLSDTLCGIAMSWTPALSVVERPTRNVLNLPDYPERIRMLDCDPERIHQIESIYVALQHEDAGPCMSVDEVVGLLKPLLEDVAVAKIAHNAKFEWHFFQQFGIDFQGLVYDTMLASYVLQPDRKHGLKSLAHEVLGHQMQEITELIGKGKKQITFRQVPVCDAARYAVCDSYVTAQLAYRFNREMDDSLRALLYELELPLIRVLVEMEANGVSLDVHYLHTLSQKLETDLKAVEQEIFILAGCEFNVNSPKQVGDILFGKLQIPAQRKTPTNSGFSTNAKILETLAPKYPVVRKILDYRQLFKLKSTYVDVLPSLLRTDRRLHTSFNQTITATGRLSSSDPNLQNIPIRTELGRSIRQGFVPADPADWYMLSADYSQIELRMLAHFSEDPHLLEAFRSGEDIHKATAALVFDVPLEEVTKEMRYRAKAVNFGIIYGQTAFGLSQALDIAPGEAAEFIRRYFERYPSVKAFIEATVAQAHQTGRVSTLFGRVRDLREGLQSKIKHIREFSERAAFNTPLQGSAADLMKEAMIRLYMELQAHNMRSKMILQVHDELVMEVYKPEAETVRRMVRQAMELSQPLRVPLEVDISEGPSWMEVE